MHVSLLFSVLLSILYSPILVSGSTHCGECSRVVITADGPSIVEHPSSFGLSVNFKNRFCVLLSSFLSDFIFMDLSGRIWFHFSSLLWNTLQCILTLTLHLTTCLGLCLTTSHNKTFLVSLCVLRTGRASSALGSQRAWCGSTRIRMGSGLWTQLSKCIVIKSLLWMFHEMKKLKKKIQKKNTKSKTLRRLTVRKKNLTD